MTIYYAVESERARSAPQIDAGKSVVEAYSTHTWVRSGQVPPTGKPTDDKVIVGYSSQGLPFVIAVDGYHRTCDRDAVFATVHEGIMLLMDEYIELLQQGYDPERAGKAFAGMLYELLPVGQAVEFTLSVSAVYEVNGQLRCSGWGVGDIGMSLKRADNGQVEPLVHGRVVRREGWEVYGKDGFDFTLSQQSRAVIERSSFHTLPVSPGDELAGSTSLFPEQTRVAQTMEYPGHTVKSLALNTPVIAAGASLFDTLNRQMAAIGQEKMQLAEWDFTHCGLVRLSFDPLQAAPEQLVFERAGERYGVYALYENTLYYITSSGMPTRIFLKENLEAEERARLLSLFPEALDTPDLQATPETLTQVSGFYGHQIAHNSMMWGDDTTVFGVHIPSVEERLQIRRNLETCEPVDVPENWRDMLRTRMRYDWLNEEYPSLTLSPASFWGRLIAGIIEMFVEVEPHLHHQEAAAPVGAVSSSSYGTMGLPLSPVASSAASSSSTPPASSSPLFVPVKPAEETRGLLTNPTP